MNEPLMELFRSVLDEDFLLESLLNQFNQSNPVILEGDWAINDAQSNFITELLGSNNNMAHSEYSAFPEKPVGKSGKCRLKLTFKPRYAELKNILENIEKRELNFTHNLNSTHKNNTHEMWMTYLQNPMFELGYMVKGSLMLFDGEYRDSEIGIEFKIHELFRIRKEFDVNIVQEQLQDSAV